jgi:hypothetical protein
VAGELPGFSRIMLGDLVHFYQQLCHLAFENRYNSLNMRCAPPNGKLLDLLQPSLGKFDVQARIPFIFRSNRHSNFFKTAFYRVKYIAGQ